MSETESAESELQPAEPPGLPPVEPPSAGFIGEWWVLPADVSFENIRVGERAARAIGTGCYQKPMADHHVDHDWSPGFFSVGPVDGNRGSRVNVFDRIAATASNPPCAGGWTHRIPYEYEVSGGFTSTMPVPFTIVPQVITTDAVGNATITKGLGTDVQNYGAPTVSDPRF